MRRPPTPPAMPDPDEPSELARSGDAQSQSRSGSQDDSQDGSLASADSLSQVSQPGDRRPLRRPPAHGDLTNLSLIDRVRAADADSWLVFMEIYRPLVAYWIRRVGLQGADIDDVCQEVFQSVSRSIQRFKKEKPTDSFRGWLRTITRARVADFVRRVTSQPASPGGDYDQQVHRRFSKADNDPFNLDDDDTTDPGEQEASLEVFRRVLELVRGTVENHTWMAFWRTAVDDQPTADVADELKMSKDAVRKAKSRMIIRLRLELGPLLDEITASAGVKLS